MKKIKKSFINIIENILKKNIYILLFCLLITFLLVEGFTNPRILQREHYFFNPQLFDDNPIQLEEVSEDYSGNDQNHWISSEVPNMPLMGTEESDSPYMMEEIYLVQDSVRDLKTNQTIIMNELKMNPPESSQCISYRSVEDHPCDTISSRELCNDKTDGSCIWTPICDFDGGGVERINCPDSCIFTDDPSNPSCTAPEPEYDVGACIFNGSNYDCQEEYEKNGGLTRSNCSFACKYKINETDDSRQGGFSLFHGL